MTAPHPSPALFMQGAKAPRISGNTPWASRYAEEIKRVLTEANTWAPRSQQVHLGPSELGVACDRQVAGKLARIPATNHVVDPWPSIVGTAVHAWLAEAFAADNTRRNLMRWIAEQKVYPHPDHSGTADLYDALEQSVDDHKVLGETSMQKVKSPGGPPRKYVAQMFLYATGYEVLGLPVRRVALIAYPRTKSSLDGIYVWESPFDDAARALVQEVFADTERRKSQAARVIAGTAKLTDIPVSPDDSECFFCPFYRPQAARDPKIAGCPGAVPSQY